MSQKSTRRGRRQTNDEDNLTLKQLQQQKKANNGMEDSLLMVPPTTPPQAAEEVKPEANGSNGNQHELVEPEKTEYITRSRSQTPQTPKKSEDKCLNGNDLVIGNEEIVSSEPSLDQSEIKLQQEDGISDNKSEEMDSLIITDETEPECLFEENSDMESGKGSPTMYRSKTRRSQTRNIPTPKTPKLMDEPEQTAAATPPPSQNEELPSSQELNSSFDSANASTRAEVGGDSTRLDYNDDSTLSENTFLNLTKNKSFAESIKHLSTRRSIRPLSDDYRKIALQRNMDKTDYTASYPVRNSVDRISIGKRKSDNESDDEPSKRFKEDSANGGFFARLTSPLSSIRNSFRRELPSSTPKLTGYKDEKCLIGEDGKVCEINEEKRWCSIM